MSRLRLVLSMVAGDGTEPLEDESFMVDAAGADKSAPLALLNCMILSSGKYSMFEPCRDSTNTLVTLLYISFMALM